MHDAWDNVVYPGMKHAVLSALLCCQDDVEHRKVRSCCDELESILWLCD